MAQEQRYPVLRIDEHYRQKILHTPLELLIPTLVRYTSNAVIHSVPRTIPLAKAPAFCHARGAQYLFGHCEEVLPTLSDPTGRVPGAVILDGACRPALLYLPQGVPLRDTHHAFGLESKEYYTQRSFLEVLADFVRAGSSLYEVQDVSVFASAQLSRVVAAQRAPLTVQELRTR